MAQAMLDDPLYFESKAPNMSSRFLTICSSFRFQNILKLPMNCAAIFAANMLRRKTVGLTGKVTFTVNSVLAIII